MVSQRAIFFFFALSNMPTIHPWNENQVLKEWEQVRKDNRRRNEGGRPQGGGAALSGLALCGRLVILLFWLRKVTTNHSLPYSADLHPRWCERLLTGRTGTQSWSSCPPRALSGIQLLHTWKLSTYWSALAYWRSYQSLRQRLWLILLLSSRPLEVIQIWALGEATGGVSVKKQAL